MTIWVRVRDWWVGQFRRQGQLRKLVWAGAPLFAFVCCGLTMCTASISPDAEPTTEAADRAATIEIETAEPTDVPPPATDEPTATPRPTTRPTNTARPTLAPTATGEPTRPPIRAATAVAATVAASQILAALPTSTDAPTPTVVPPTTAPTLAPTIAPTAVPPTTAPTLAPTVAPTAAPTQPPQPTATSPAAGGLLAIINVDKAAEVVTIRNNGGTEVNLTGWLLRSEKGNQDCGLGGIIGPGQTLQIWAMAEDAGQGGYNCGFDSNIWNNSETDTAILIDPQGQVVSSW